MKCSEVKEIIELYASGEGTTNIRDKVNSHLNNCIACAEYKETTTRFLEQLNDDFKILITRRPDFIPIDKEAVKKIQFAIRGSSPKTKNSQISLLIGLAATFMIAVTVIFVSQNAPVPSEYSLANGTTVQVKSGGLITKVSENVFKLEKGTVSVRMKTPNSKIIISTKSNDIEIGNVDSDGDSIVEVTLQGDTESSQETFMSIVTGFIRVTTSKGILHAIDGEKVIVKKDRKLEKLGDDEFCKPCSEKFAKQLQGKERPCHFLDSKCKSCGLESQETEHSKLETCIPCTYCFKCAKKEGACAICGVDLNKNILRKARLLIKDLEHDNPIVRDAATFEVIGMIENDQAKKLLEEKLKKAEQNNNDEIKSKCITILENFHLYEKVGNECFKLLGIKGLEYVKLIAGAESDREKLDIFEGLLKQQQLDENIKNGLGKYLVDYLVRKITGKNKIEIISSPGYYYRLTELIKRHSLKGTASSLVKLLLDNKNSGSNRSRILTIQVLAELGSSEYADEIAKTSLGVSDNILNPLTSTAIQALAVFNAKKYAEDIAKFLYDKQNFPYALWAMYKFDAKDYAKVFEGYVANPIRRIKFFTMNDGITVAELSEKALKQWGLWKNEYDEKVKSEHEKWIKEGKCDCKGCRGGPHLITGGICERCSSQKKCNCLSICTDCGMDIKICPFCQKMK